MSRLMMLGGSKTTRLSETDQPPDNVRASKCVATYIDSYRPEQVGCITSSIRL